MPIGDRVRAFWYNMGSGKKIIGTVLGVLILTASLGIGAYLVQQRQTRTRATGVDVSLSSTNQSPKVGDTFIVTVGINTQGASVSGADLKVAFDSNLLQATAIQAGNFLPTVLTPGAISGGNATIVMGALFDQAGAHPQTGTGYLAQINFTAKAAGSTSISFGTGSAVAVLGQSSNAIGTSNPITINVTSTTPTGSPGPVPTLTSVTVVTSYNPWHLDIHTSGSNVDATQKARLIDSTGSQWGVDTPLYIISTSQSSIGLPSNSPPSGCNVGKTCTISMYIVTSTGALSNKFNFNLPAVAAPITPSISSVQIVTGYTPLHLDIKGANMDATQKARLFDNNGTQWGPDIPLYIISSTESSVALPSNSPPSGCNIGTTCTLGIYIITSTGALSNKSSFVLPAK